MPNIFKYAGFKYTQHSSTSGPLLIIEGVPDPNIIFGYFVGEVVRMAGPAFKVAVKYAQAYLWGGVKGREKHKGMYETAPYYWFI